MEFVAGKGRRFVGRIYRLRVAGAVLGFPCVGSAFMQQHRGVVLWVLLALYCFAWPPIARRAALAAEVPYRGERLNLMIDAAFGGLWVVAMRFNILPSVLVIAMLSMGNIAAGGPRLFVRGIAAHALGIAVGALLIGVALDPVSTLPTLIGCVPMLLLYPLALGWATYRMSQKLAQRTRELELLSRTDGLTGLHNRRHWEGLLADEFERCRTVGYASCLLLMDLDHFKRVNDTFGHPAGDAVLQAFADMLRAQFRGSDMIGRYGGEEFGVVLTGATLAEGEAIAERFLRHVRETSAGPNARCPCTVSAGIVQCTADLPDYHSWLLAADQCLYDAKVRGRDRLVVGGNARHNETDTSDFEMGH